jgi:hypothetical protein
MLCLTSSLDRECWCSSSILNWKKKQFNFNKITMRKIAFRKAKTFPIASQVFLIFPGCLDYRCLFRNVIRLLSSYAKITHDSILFMRFHILVESHDLLEDTRTELRHRFLKCRKYLKIPLNLYKLNEFMQLNL